MTFEKVEMTYKDFYNLFGKGDHEVPYDVLDDIYIKTPTGFTRINKVVCKHNHNVVRIDFENNIHFECSENHLFKNGDTPVLAADATYVDTVNGTLQVLEKTPIGTETVFDISIESPHWYIANDENNIIHHNTYFVLGIVKAFLDSHPEAGVIYYDTEAAVTKQMMEQRGIDVKRIIVSEPDTIQKFKTHALKTLDFYEKSGDDKPPFMMVLDSLGHLSTSKEMEDTAEGKDTRDMTKAQVIKAAFRVLTLKLAKVKVPLIITNHVYAAVGSYVPTNEISGGCLVAGTKIFTINGLEEIQNIKKGDLVLTMDGYHSVTNTFTFNDKEVYEVEFEDGSAIKCSEDHKFLVENEWISVRDMLDMDMLPVVERILV